MSLQRDLVARARSRARSMPLVAITIDAYRSWRADRTIRLGAGLAYYALFGVVPFITLAVSIASFVFAQDEVRSVVSESLSQVIGVAEADLISEAVADELAESDTSLSFGLISVVSLIAASSLLLIALQDALNMIFGVPVEVGIRHTLRRRLVAFAMVLGLASVLLVSLMLRTVLAGIVELLGLDHLEVVGQTLLLGGRLASLALVAVTLTTIYKLLPRTSVPWSAALIGAIAATVAGLIASVLLGWYLKNVATDSIEGAAGGLALVLMYIFALSQIALAGAQLVKALVNRPEPATPPGGSGLRST